MTRLFIKVEAGGGPTLENEDGCIIQNASGPEADISGNASRHVAPRAVPGSLPRSTIGGPDCPAQAFYQPAARWQRDGRPERAPDNGAFLVAITRTNSINLRFRPI